MSSRRTILEGPSGLSPSSDMSTAALPRRLTVVSLGEVCGSASASTSTSKKATRRLSMDNSRPSERRARSLSKPRRPQRSSSSASRRSAQSAKTTAAAAATEQRRSSRRRHSGTVQETPPQERHHREHRHHRDQRTRQRTGISVGSLGGRRNSKLGLSSPTTMMSTVETFLSQRRTRGLRSLLAFWTGGGGAGNRIASKRRSAKTAQKGKDKQVVWGPTPAEQNGAVKRLGEHELGKYAHEERMPDHVIIYLRNGWGVCRRGLIPMLRKLLGQSTQTDYAYLCDPCVQHVSRLPKEGPFCGYRNIQTLYSYLVGGRLTGHDLYGGKLPSIFDVQELIEAAWDAGFNAQGRIETGGIRWTRKHIGTPEAVAVFQSLGVPFSACAFKESTPAKTRDLLLRDVEQYFSRGVVVEDDQEHDGMHDGDDDGDAKDAERRLSGRKKRRHGVVRSTRLPPIYWQHPGHSLTIVGLEKTKAGTTNLLVFDPNFVDTAPMSRLVGRRRVEAHFPDQVLRAYRRGPQYVGKFTASELLK